MVEQQLFSCFGLATMRPPLRSRGDVAAVGAATRLLHHIGLMQGTSISADNHACTRLGEAAPGQRCGGRVLFTAGLVPSELMTELLRLRVTRGLSATED